MAGFSMFIGRAGDVFGVSLDKIKHVWYNGEIGAEYALELLYFGRIYV